MNDKSYLYVINNNDKISFHFAPKNRVIIRIGEVVLDMEKGKAIELGYRIPEFMSGEVVRRTKEEKRDI